MFGEYVPGQYGLSIPNVLRRGKGLEAGDFARLLQECMSTDKSLDRGSGNGVERENWRFLKMPLTFFFLVFTLYL